MLWRVRLWLFNLALIWKSVKPLLLPRISWEKISINHLTFDFNNIDIWSDIWRLTLGWNLTKSAFGLSIEFRVQPSPPNWLDVSKITPDFKEIDFNLLIYLETNLVLNDLDLIRRNGLDNACEEYKNYPRNSLLFNTYTID